MTLELNAVVGIVFLLVNGLLALLPPTFIYFLVKHPEFRSWVVKLIEDGDGVPHKQDAKDAVILFFAFVFCWVEINLILIKVVFPFPDAMSLIIAGGAIISALFGISQFKLSK